MQGRRGVDRGYFLLGYVGSNPTAEGNQGAGIGEPNTARRLFPTILSAVWAWCSRRFLLAKKASASVPALPFGRVVKLGPTSLESAKPEALVPASSPLLA